jgi:hypothetical protein
VNQLESAGGKTMLVIKSPRAYAYRTDLSSKSRTFIPLIRTRPLAFPLHFTELFVLFFCPIVVPLIGMFSDSLFVIHKSHFPKCRKSFLFLYPYFDIPIPNSNSEPSWMSVNDKGQGQPNHSLDLFLRLN